MKVLWLSWKDLSHPQAGGAEAVSDNLCRRLARDGHDVILLTAGYEGCQSKSKFHGYTIVRVGGRWSVYWQAAIYYRRHLRSWPDRVIEEVNTFPFFARWYCWQPHQLFFHQLCRRVWFYQMVFPLSLIGYCLEPIYLWLLRGSRVITISDSTRDDLRRFGFSAGRITVIPQSVDIARPSDQTIKQSPKLAAPTLLSLGSIRAMKRPLDQIIAFEIAKETIGDLQLMVAGSGSGPYYRRVRRHIENSRFRDSIHLLGRISEEEKPLLMRRCHAILVTSVKEGWGLIVSEAALQGTPAIVYNVDGLRDSVEPKTDEVLVSPNPSAMATAIVKLLQNKPRYEEIRSLVRRRVARLTPEKSYQSFSQSLLQ